MKHVCILPLLFLLINVNAQVAVNQDGLPADSSAMLDVRSTTKGMLIPRMSTTQREMIATPATGLLVFDTNSTSFWFYGGTEWTELGADAPTPDKISDADEDTRVDVEQNSDEDMIRFTVGGTEFFRMDSGRVEVSNTGGSILIGRGAGLNEDLSERNTVAIGDSVMYYSGMATQYYHSVFNTAVGARSLLNNTEGFYNTAIGGHALRGNREGHRNTAIGLFALQRNLSGVRNTAVGMEAMDGSVLGADNTALGFRAGFNSMGSGNVFLGYQAGYSETGSEKLYIDNSTTSQPLIYGDFATDSLVIHGKLAYKADGGGPAVGVVAQDSNDVLQYMSYERLIDSLNANGLMTGGGSDEDWLVAGGLPPMDNTSHIYHEDSVTVGKNMPGGTGVLNVLGRIDVFSETDSTSLGIGMSALGSGNTGTHNTAVGYQALYANTSGYNNTATGTNALPANTSGTENTATGANALYSNMGGEANTATGVNTMYHNTTGMSNTAAGLNSMFNNTEGNNNTAMGRGAMYHNVTGSTNTAIGSNSLNLNTAGINNVAVGDSAAYHSTSSNITAIGKSALFSNTSQEQNTAVGYRALYSNTASTNSAVGYRALEANTSGYNNTAVGSEALISNTDGLLNTAMGHKALEDNTGGDYNSAFGAYALGNNTTANNNTAFGEAAAYHTTTGAGNSVFGATALYFNEYGYYNVAIGLQSMYVSTEGGGNVAVGTSTLRLNTTGDDNCAIGYLSLHDNTTGSKNTGVGRAALADNTTGNNRTALGYSANSTGTNFTNSTGLGYNADCTTADQIVVGNFAVTEIGGAVGWSEISDGRFKSDVREDVAGLEFIKALRPVTYHQDLRAIDDWWAENYGERDTLLMEQNWITEKSDIRYSGFIAQEVEETAEAIGYEFSGVDTPKNDQDYYSLRYSEFTVPLVKAVQELSAENERLREELDELKSVVEGLKG